MTEIGECIDSDAFVKATNLESKKAIRGGIFFNEKEENIILLQRVGKEPAYPNYWDEDCIGLLHYCGTNKGLSSSCDKQTLASDTLNGRLNEGLYPIHLYVSHKANSYCYFGKFTRLKKYDEELKIDDRTVYRFGLISNNIDAIRPMVCSIIESGQMDFEEELQTDEGNYYTKAQCIVALKAYVDMKRTQKSKRGIMEEISRFYQECLPPNHSVGSVSRLMCNFQYLDPNDEHPGCDHVSSVANGVWDEYFDPKNKDIDSSRLQKDELAIRLKYVNN